MKILSWGSNSNGQLGQGIQSEQNIFPSEVSITPQPSDSVKCITGGGKHTLFLRSTGKLMSCGHNDKGQLGKPTSEKLYLSFQCITNLNQTFVIEVTCGWDFNLALSNDFEVFGWGSNYHGQLGKPRHDFPHVSNPTKVFDGAIYISAGLRHSALVTLNGHLFSSGCGRKGQLGFLINGKIPDSSECFTEVANISDFVKVECGENYSLAVTKSNEIFAWGNNKFGQLGINPLSYASTSTPIQVCHHPTDIKTLAAGWTHSMILSEDGEITNWGRNDYGQLGEGRPQPWIPTVIKNIPKVKQIAVGSHHNVALTVNGKILSWGWNEHGNCGNGNLENVNQASEVDFGIGNPIIIGSGAGHSFLCLE